jgi:hypothetical protein
MLLNEFLSRVHNTPLKIKRSEMDSRSHKILTNSYKYSPQDQEKGLKKKGKEKIKR